MGRDPNCARCWGTGFYKGWGAACDCVAPTGILADYEAWDWSALTDLVDEQRGPMPPLVASSCDKTFEGCRANGNEVRFGGALPYTSRCPYVFKDRNCGLADA